jgi:hypothetical protein
LAEIHKLEEDSRSTYGLTIHDLAIKGKKNQFPEDVVKIVVEMKSKHVGLMKQSRILSREMFEMRFRDPTLPPPPAHHHTAAPAPEEAVPKLTMPCPMDGCLGFILSQNWECGMCATKVCKDCHAVDNGNHTCNKDDVLTAKALAAESKPCPHCAVATFKISGCNQMWCVMCHKPWNWITGKPDHGVIHNPHYFDYIRKNPNARDRAPHHLEFGAEEVVPGDGAEVIFLRQWEQNNFAWVGNAAAVPPLDTVLMYVPDENNRRLLSTFYQRTTHLYSHERYKLLNGNFTDNMNLRISFMRKEITDKEFKVQLQRREKQTLKFAEYARIIEGFCVTARNILRDVVRMIIRSDEAMQLLTRLWLDSGEHLITAAAKYQAKTPKFFEIRRLRA